MITRRTFLKIQGAAVGALAILPSTTAQAKKLAIGLDKAEALKAVGGSVVLKVKDMEILFVRDSETTVRAIDPTCTHQKCKVAYAKDARQFQCGCHKSTFDLDGKVQQGPATAPLKIYAAQLDGTRILLTVDE